MRSSFLFSSRDLSIVAAIVALGSVIGGCSAGAIDDTDDDTHATNDAIKGAAEPAAPPAFLEPASYANLLRIDPAFPFAVTGKHSANGGAVLGARWGRHGGPSVTSQSFGASATPAKVLRYDIDRSSNDPALSATIDATSTTHPIVAAPNLPSQRFWGADGMVDLPFGELAMQAYTTSSGTFAGEIVFYKSDYQSIAGRANVNGFYSGIGISKSAKSRILYSGLSGLATSPLTANESGLYASEVCNDSPVPSATNACSGSGSFKLFGWSGFSGPVAKDASGNVFVAAFTPGGAAGSPSDLVYGLASDQSFSTQPLTPATVASASTNGTGSLVAASRSGSSRGWLLGKGYDGELPAPVWAQAYTYDGAAVATDGAALADVIAPADTTSSLTLFTDDDGRIWIALETADSGSWLFELEAKP